MSEQLARKRKWRSSLELVSAGVWVVIVISTPKPFDNFASAALDARQKQTSPSTGQPMLEQAVKKYEEVTARAVEFAVREAYQREFAEVVPVPAIFNDVRSVDCKGNGHVTTTAYLKRGEHSLALLQMYLSRDGSQVVWQSISYVMAPVGAFKTLVVIVRYPQTVNENSVKLFEKAQTQINEDHAAFARKQGYRSPLVVFENTNLLVEPSEIADPHKPLDVRAAAERKGVSPAGHQLVVVIDPDPERTAGGLSMPGGDIYVGNYGSWKETLREREWSAIARTVYHHEVPHQWGWDHRWSPTCGATKLGFEPFPAPPLLFGWEDVDGRWHARDH